MPAALLAPLFSQFVTTGDPTVDPLDLPGDRISNRRQNGFLKITDRMSQVFRHNGVRKIANLVKSVANRTRHIADFFSGFLHVYFLRQGF